MPITFRKRKKILPGVYLNFSKGGISTTVGPRGLNLNFGKQGVYLNTGIPGTGLFSRQKIEGNEPNPSLPYSNIFTNDTNFVKPSTATSSTLEQLKKHIEEGKLERRELEVEINQQQATLQQLARNLKSKKSGIRKFFSKQETIHKLEIELSEAKEYLSELYNQYEDSQVNINIESDKEFQEQYLKVKNAYIVLTKASKIWDIVSERTTAENKSAAKTSIERREVAFTFDKIDFILSEHSAFHLENADGDNLYIYPAFIIQINRSEQITLIELNELKFKFYRQRFLEEKTSIPSDSKIIDYTWAKVNKDGSADRRFAGNYQIPVVEYGAFEFSTHSGLQEIYYISNLQLAENFANEFGKYLHITSTEIQSQKKEKYVDAAGSEFTNSYYTLLEDFSKDLQNIRDILIKNQTLAEKFKLNSENINTSIPYLIVYELCQILRRLSEVNIVTSSLEATALLLLSNRIFLNQERDLLDEGYIKIAKFYESGSYTNAASTILEIGDSENIKFKIASSNSNELTWADELTKKLPIVVALKLQEDPHFEEYAQLLYHFANIIAKADNKISAKEECRLKEIYKAIHNPLPQTANQAKITSSSNETIEELLDELNSLIGLDAVKSEVNSLINFIKVQKAREELGLKSSSLSYHIVFTGNPGTGKTTVARIIAKIYKHLGILNEGQLVETDRSGLIAEYVGQTAIKVNKIINSALNGVLFIDEAYALVGESKDDFGREAVATLIKRMEDDRDKLVIILAGYTNEMTNFVDTNPGFKSRFNRYINFPDYTSQELFEIFESKCKKLDYHLTEGAKNKIKTIFESAYSIRTKSFGNGRFVRNTFEKTLEQQANRIAKESNLTKEILTTITEEDVSEK